MMAIDQEKLIEAVKKREVLYISAAKLYKDSNMKEKAGAKLSPNHGVRDSAQPT